MRFPTPLIRTFASPARKMTSDSTSKLIFAPSSDPATRQAAQFTKGSLDLADLAPDPFQQFAAWFAHAHACGVPQAEACTLSTAQLPSGRVSARVLYLKELEARSSGGFVVYSNTGTSRKAADLRTNRWAALTFWWRELERQVRVEGTVEMLAPEESQVYFDTRIRGSRIGAWASEQSTVLRGREELEGRVKDAKQKFEGQESIPVPDHWGGLRVVPESVEFWQGRHSRLHDRFLYTKGSGKSEWTIERLSP
ncbi:hypothetical protein BDY21DRAFT_339124 [Lineolata rhizophorae]|uniref:pyridoxal 5'-phosphate synthase n=1 Tax=Lineolata rhizophorae TaxID=578093 RepID=A0A6A6P500_9PEZI|nr:hypothetical protein BDY21DRAFT_339124 [Lineolata rhizophorae]